MGGRKLEGVDHVRARRMEKHFAVYVIKFIASSECEGIGDVGG